MNWTVSEHHKGSIIIFLVDYINKHTFSDCYEIFKNRNSAPSGYYNIHAPKCLLLSVYCDMEDINCDGKGGWMRVGYFNMNRPNATCPHDLTQQQYNYWLLCVLYFLTQLILSSPVKESITIVYVVN